MHTNLKESVFLNIYAALSDVSVHRSRKVKNTCRNGGAFLSLGIKIGLQEKEIGLQEN